MGCLSLEAPSWLWTPPLSTHSMPGCRTRKERRYPELVGRGRARLVVLAVEVCGRWSQETQRFLSFLARAKARSVPPLLRKRVEQAWRLRWGSLFSCTVAGAVASSLLELLALGVPMVCVLLPTRWNGTSGMLAWINFDVTVHFILCQKKEKWTPVKLCPTFSRGLFHFIFLYSLPLWPHP